MLTRRHLCCGAAVTAAAVASVRASHAAECTAFTSESQQALSPAEAVQRLRDGNARFVAGQMMNCDLIEQVHATAGGQAPFAAVLGCIDSRVPPELVFDQGVGDLFVARIAGNFANTDIMGSLEFATAVAGARAIVVLGHSACGAIRGAIDDVDLGLLTATLANIKPAVQAVAPEGGSSSDAALVQDVADVNVGMTVAKLQVESSVLGGLVDEGKLTIVGAMHDITTGKVTFL